MKANFRLLLFFARFLVTMKDLLLNISLYYAPILVPLVSCRMMQLTFEFGYCKDTIPGLAYMSHCRLLLLDIFGATFALFFVL